MGSSELVQKIFHYSDEGMILFNRNGEILDGNPSLLALTGLKHKEIIGAHLSTLFPPQLQEKGIDTILADLAQDGLWKGGLVRKGRTGNPEKYSAVLMTHDQISDDCQKFIGLITPLEERIESNYDSLTGLAGPSLFKDRVEQAMFASRREKNRPAVFVVNIDRLSLINDGLGHQVGDGVIREIARRLSASFRETDTVARIAGDSFALLLKIKADDHAALVAEKILKNVCKPICVQDQNVVITASLGIATSSSMNRSVELFIGRAESALNRAKDMGGNQYQFFSKDLNETAKKRIEIENNLRSAMSSNEFLLYYQPKVDTRFSRIIGMEALIRWQHPQRGMVTPYSFIPIAEETGMILEIGRWVLHEACRQNVEWQNKNLPAVPVAVNVSARQFQHETFVEDVKSVLESTGMAPKYLELEITENMLMSDIEQTIDKLNELSGVGLSMAIDDFGTGYSNLSYLVRFPVTTLKIDRAFIKNVDSDDTIAALTRSIIKMSQNLNLRVVAEGAENIEHINFLTDHGCNVVQGYFFSKPVSADEFEKLLEHGVDAGRSSSTSM